VPVWVPRQFNLHHNRKKEFWNITLRWDSHFWWQRKENGPSQGIADGMSRGRDMNVFSTMSAAICVGVVSWYVTWRCGERGILLTAWGLR